MKKNMNIFKILFPAIFVLSIVFSFFFLSVAFAEEPLRPEIVIDIGGFSKDDFSQQSSYACKEGSKDQCIDINWLGQYISAIYRYGIGLAAILAVVMVMAGGFLWLVSAGSSNKVSTAKEYIFSAITGLTLALFSFIILSAINPNLVNLKGLTINDISEKVNVCCQTGTDQYSWQTVPEGECNRQNSGWSNAVGNKCSSCCVCTPHYNDCEKKYYENISAEQCSGYNTEFNNPTYPPPGYDACNDGVNCEFKATNSCDEVR